MRTPTRPLRRHRGFRRTTAGLAAAIVLGACSSTAAAPPVLFAYDLPAVSTPFRLGLEVDGTADVGGPDDTSALSQVLPTSGLKLSARLRLDYDQDVAATDGGRTVVMHASAISGRFSSFVASRDFGAGDLAAVGRDGTVTLRIDSDGEQRDSGGAPLGGFGLPVVGDVLTGWPCPPLPEGGAAPDSTWPVVVTTPSGAHLAGTASYTPGDVAGRHVLEVGSEVEGDLAVTGVDLQSVVASVSAADLPNLHLSPMNLHAHVRSRNKCRLDAGDMALTSWSVDSTVDVTFDATSDAKYDAILDGTTMSLDVAADAAPVG